ncbi:MAG: RNA polymerase sigma factor [Gammaproteobacteria bacterium]|nr:RNA polymerase sigma factor [Gammaproteobacteria bacterium]MDH5799836.1 RNA polymerase sigma factor [Gammaproteobacteria bacterium]
MDKLLKWLQKPSKSQFDDWIRLYHRALYKHALWMTGSRDNAEDVVQETFFQAWTAMGSLKDPDKALPWLLTILRRAVYREQRCRYRHSETIQELIQLDQGVDQSIMTDAYTMIEIYDSLETLSPKLRDAFLLYHLHGFSYEEISDQLNIPVGTVMSRLSRARDTLKSVSEITGGKVVSLKKLKRGVAYEK